MKDIYSARDMDGNPFGFLLHAVTVGVLCGIAAAMIAPVALVLMGVLGIHLMG